MTQELRKKHIEFIENDTKSRDETIVSDIIFFAAIYYCRVKLKGHVNSKKVNYTAAQEVMRGYREIKL